MIISFYKQSNKDRQLFQFFQRHANALILENFPKAIFKD